MTDDYLPDTQTPEFLDCQSQNSQGSTHGTMEIKTPYARLFSLLPELEAVDLVASKVSLGRAEACDIVLHKGVFPVNLLINVSKEHFCITRDEGSPLVCLTDLSKNGTFVNGQLVGKGKTNVLQNDDVISVGHTSIRVYVFKPMDSTDFTYLPMELRKRYFPSTPLGNGACGEVRLAFEKSGCKTYAIKKIVKYKYVSASDVKPLNHPSKIKTEINILKSLKHPFIIGLKEIVETDTEVFIVLEYMQGGVLTNRIQGKTRMSESEVKFLFYQMLLGLQYLHENGIVHRDLKPENVLLSSDGPNPQVKISDFGLSKVLEESELLITVCGTPHYVAPEVINQSYDNYSRKVDVWSMGVILYYMLCGKLPFDTTDKRKLNFMIMTGEIDWEKNWTNVSFCARNLVMKMLTVDPEYRIDVGDILKHPWIDKDLTVQYRVWEFLQGAEQEYSPPAKRQRLDSEGSSLSSTG